MLYSNYRYFQAYSRDTYCTHNDEQPYTYRSQNLLQLHIEVLELNTRVLHKPHTKQCLVRLLHLLKTTFIGHFSSKDGGDRRKST